MSLLIVEHLVLALLYPELVAEARAVVPSMTDSVNARIFY